MFELGSFEFGKCAVIQPNVRIRDTDGAWLDIHAKTGPLVVFLSEDGPNEMGVACNYWGRWPFRCQTVIILIASVF